MNFWEKTILNRKAMVIDMKTYHYTNMFTKLNLT